MISAGTEIRIRRLMRKLDSAKHSLFSSQKKEPEPEEKLDSYVRHKIRQLGDEI